MNFLKLLWTALGWAFNSRVFRTTGDIKKDEERRKKFKTYAIASVICAVIACVSTPFFFKWAIDIIVFSTTTWLLVIGNILVFVFGLVMFFGPIGAASYSLTFAIAQLIINRKWYSWLALVISILSIGISIFLVIYGLGDLLIGG